MNDGMRDAPPHELESAGLAGRVRLAAHRVRAFVQTSSWTSLATRVLSFAIALIVLAWIGRAAAHAGTTARFDPWSMTDAGVLPVSSAIASFAPAPAPAPSSAASLPAPAALAAPPTAGRSRATVDDPVYINHAGAEDLRRLPGVGAKRADAIVALRQRIGRFQRIEELLRVKGIGRKAVQKWRPLVRLEAPPAARSDAGS